MNGPRLLLLGALVALAPASSASAADLVIKVRNKHVSALGAFRTNGSAACTSATRRPRSSSSTPARSRP